jgi:hypothetical protein
MIKYGLFLMEEEVLTDFRTSHYVYQRLAYAPLLM